MKIAFVVSTFFPHLGGMGAVVDDEAKALAKLGHNITVFTMRYKNDQIEEKRDGFVVKRLKPVWQIGDGGVVNFNKYFKYFNDFDLVHLHLPWYGSAWLSFRVIKKLHKPYVVTLHMEGQLTGLKKIYQKISERFVLPKILSSAFKVLLVNNIYFNNKYYLKNLSVNKIVELSNPVDTKIFNLATPESVNRQIFRGIDAVGVKIILFVGNLMPVKRLDLLLQAIKQGEQNWRLAIVGGGYDAARYKNLAQDLGISSKVKFFGNIDRNKLPEFYQAADVVVVPSDSESFSLVAVESLASGTPVIVSSAVKLEESLSSLVARFELGSTENLIVELKKLLNKSKTDSDIASSLEIARTYIINNFDLELHVNKLSDIYSQAIADK